MNRAKIGIRYCGGCNPHYERVEAIRQVQSAVGDRFLFLRHDQQGLDGLIAVNGCPRTCAVKNLELRGIPYRSISEKDDLESLMEWIFAFEQNGTK